MDVIQSGTAWAGLGPEFTIVHAEAQRQALLSALIEHAGGLTLDLSDITAMDTSGVQLLLALGRSLAARGQTLRIDGASPVVQDVLQVYGLLSLLAGLKED